MKLKLTFFLCRSPGPRTLEKSAHGVVLELIFWWKGSEDEQENDGTIAFNVCVTSWNLLEMSHQLDTYRNIVLNIQLQAQRIQFSIDFTS